MNLKEREDQFQVQPVWFLTAQTVSVLHVQIERDSVCKSQVIKCCFTVSAGPSTADTGVAAAQDKHC